MQAPQGKRKDIKAVIKDADLVCQYAKRAKALVRDSVASGIGYNITDEEMVLFGSAGLFLQGAYRCPRDLDFSVYDPQVFDLMKAGLRDFAEMYKVRGLKEMPTSLRFNLTQDVNVDIIATGPLFEPYVVNVNCPKQGHTLMCEQKEHVVERLFHSRFGPLDVKAILDFSFLSETNETFATELLVRYPTRNKEIADLFHADETINELANYLPYDDRNAIITKVKRAKRLVEKNLSATD
jgi:hypothetical protein